MAAAIAGRLGSATQPSFDSVTSIFTEWERLLGRRQVLAGEAELGLWGELWCISRSSCKADLLDGWRGPERERVDILLDGLGVEIKASCRAGVHFVSQSQVDSSLGEVAVVLMSLHVMPDPLRGRSLAELVRCVSSEVHDPAAFEEKLASTGYSHDDEGAYTRRYALVGQPQLYAAEDVPRVRVADPGVSDLRYRVELRPDVARSGATLDRILATLGLDIAAMSLPCA